MRASFVFAVLLLLSLGGKAAFSRPAADEGAADFTGRAVETLTHQGYSTARESRPFATSVHAERGNCRMIVAEYRAHGTIAAPLATLVAPIGPLRYVWRGTTSVTPPKAAPLLQYYVRRELRRIGFAPDHLPIVAVAASPGCTRPVDWGALAALPA